MNMAKNIVDMTQAELEVFRLIQDKVVKDSQFLFENTGQLRDIINESEKQEKAKLEAFIKQVDLMKELLRNIEEGKYKGGR
jgi:hypothetical protein